MRTADYPSMSCSGCRELIREEGQAPPCRSGACPVAPPEGIAGMAAAVWGDLRALARTLGGSGPVLKAHGVEPDRLLMSLLRFLDGAAHERFGKKLERIEYAR